MCLRLEEFTRSRESHVFQSESCGNTSFSALTSIPKQQCETVLIKMILLTYRSVQYSGLLMTKVRCGRCCRRIGNEGAGYYVQICLIAESNILTGLIRL